MKKKTLCILIILLMLLSSLSSCSKSEKSAETSSESWSIFLYFCGTDLETEVGAASDNIYEMMNASISSNVNVIMQTGGTKEWWVDGIDEDKLQRFQLKDNSFYLVDEQPLASMGSADTLGDFLSWGVAEYPAENYMVILWDHGAGSVNGVAFDELYNYDSLDINELAAGLSKAEATFEIVGFDACLMSSLEVGCAVEPYAKYMVASEEYIPQGGWDYDEMLDYIVNNASKSSERIAREICDTYYDKCYRSDSEDMATLSVVDLSKIQNVEDCFAKMAEEMTAVTEDVYKFQELSMGANRAENYGGNTDYEGYTNMIDLGSLAENTESLLSGASEDVLDALSQCVVYQVKGESREDSKGLSVFFPLKADEQTLNTYSILAPTQEYVRFLDAATSWSAPEAIVPQDEKVDSVQEGDYDIDFETWISEDGCYYMEITKGLESVSSVTFSLYYMDYEYNEYMLLGEDNDINSDWESGIFYDNFRGVWPAINGYLCNVQLIEEQDDYNIYSIPILLNGRQTNLRAAYVWDKNGDGHFEIYGVWDGVDSDTGMSARNTTSLINNDEIEFIFRCANWESSEVIKYTIGGFTVEGDVTMEEAELPDGEYMYQYEIEDIFGNTTYSQEIFMTIEDGEIYLDEAQ